MSTFNIKHTDNSSCPERTIWTWRIYKVFYLSRVANMRAQFLRTPEIGPGNVFEKLLIGFEIAYLVSFMRTFNAKHTDNSSCPERKIWTWKINKVFYLSRVANLRAYFLRIPEIGPGNVGLYDLRYRACISLIFIKQWFEFEIFKKVARFMKEYYFITDQQSLFRYSWCITLLLWTFEILDKILSNFCMIFCRFFFFF